MRQAVQYVKLEGPRRVRGGKPLGHARTDVQSDGLLAFLVAKLLFAMAVTAFAYLIRVARSGEQGHGRMAPTHLRQAGTLAGLVAGGLSAVGYALHCTADSLPFVAIWYSGTVLLHTFAGAIAGRGCYGGSFHGVQYSCKAM